MTDTNPWLQTHSGRAWSLHRPSAEDVNWNDIANSLAKICRFGGHCKTHYSVAQHCVLVSAQVPPEARAHALLHDAHEAYLGDITHPMKQALRNGARRLAFADLLEAMAFRTDRAIFNAARLEWPIPSIIAGEIKRADIQLLFAERRALMAPPPDDWTGENKYPRLTLDIEPLGWEDAAKLYLNALTDAGIMTTAKVQA